MTDIPARVRRAILVQSCQRNGHTFEHAVTFATGEPTAILCPRCERSWTVTPDSDLDDDDEVVEP